MKDMYVKYSDGTMVKSPVVSNLKRIMVECNINTKDEMIEWYHLMISDYRTRPKGMGMKCLNLLKDLTIS